MYSITGKALRLIVKRNSNHGSLIRVLRPPTAEVERLNSLLTVSPGINMRLHLTSGGYDIWQPKSTRTIDTSARMAIDLNPLFPIAENAFILSKTQTKRPSPRV